MAVSGSMFLTEIVVSELRSCVKCKDFVIKSQFVDLFSVILKESKETEKLTPAKKKNKRKTKVRKNAKQALCRNEFKAQSGQSILFTNDVANLIKNMKQYPMEISLWSKAYPKYKIASTNIPWKSNFIEYLEKIRMGLQASPIALTDEYNVFDEVSSRRMAVLKLKMKLSYLTDKVTSQLKSLTEENPQNLDTILTKVKEPQFNLAEETGIIRTVYSGGKKHFKKSKPKKPKIVEEPIAIKEKPIIADAVISKKSSFTIDLSLESKNKDNSFISLVKSDTDMDKSKQIDLFKCKSCSSITKEHLKILNYIFGDPFGTFGNQVYCVNYFTIDDTKNTPSTAKTSVKSSSNSVPVSSLSEKNDTSEKSSAKKTYKFKLCDNDCPLKSESMGSIDIPIENAISVKVNRCKDVNCKHKEFRKLPPPPDDRILLDLTSLKNKCCELSGKQDTIEKVEEVLGGMVATMQMGDDPCYCECKCKFGFTKKTRYCKICGGYEVIGEEIIDNPQLEFPCPIYHNLTDKAKIKPSITSDSRKTARGKSIIDKSIESEKETKKGKKKKKDDKFKFNYGYTAPHIGHDNCAQPCTGTLGEVPKSMGWLWTADNVPGMKFRPMWKPGAVNKHVLRLLRMARNPGEVFAKKKKRKDMGKGKKPLKRPLLIVHKKDGEYTITMETMKAYSKPRAINQVPYEDKDALTYTIGRTEEENRQRRIKKERAQRRLERAQREFIQSAFKDMCQEICLKTYQQALGILPDAEDPDCTCYPAEPGADQTDLDHSCSCSEDSDLSFSDTDSDEWIVEFTPPSATFDPAYKTKKIFTAENTSQYNYLDYKVNLLDRYGNPVPRFFKGPDGKEQCSDLGGFWSPDHKWLEINVDGFIGPDGKWAPNMFIGPDGEHVDAEIGKFQAADGTWLVVGVDGFVDCTGKWRYYSKTGKLTDSKRRRAPVSKDNRAKVAAPQKVVQVSKKKSEGTWSCFGDANPNYLSKLGILGHGHDRKLLLDTLKSLISQGEVVKIPKPSFIPRSGKRRKTKVKYNSDIFDANKIKCRHPLPSSKGVVAMDDFGNKIYFRFKDSKNRRPKQRMENLTSQGISLSSFHVPCFHSFINSEVMKKQLYKRREEIAQQHGYVRKQPRGPPPRSECSSGYGPRGEPRYRNALV